MILEMFAKCVHVFLKKAHRSLKTHSKDAAQRAQD